jgi:hypothetical protein
LPTTLSPPAHIRCTFLTTSQDDTVSTRHLVTSLKRHTSVNYPELVRSVIEGINRNIHACCPILEPQQHVLLKYQQPPRTENANAKKKDIALVTTRPPRVTAILQYRIVVNQTRPKAFGAKLCIARSKTPFPDLDYSSNCCTGATRVSAVRTPGRQTLLACIHQSVVIHLGCASRPCRLVLLPTQRQNLRDWHNSTVETCLPRPAASA